MTDAIHPRLPLVSTGCACCAPPAAPDEPASANPRMPSDVSTSTTYRVEGMTCSHCTGRVTAALTALEGVQDVEIDLVAGDTSTVTVISQRPMSTEAVRSAIEEVGYTLATS